MADKKSWKLAFITLATVAGLIIMKEKMSTGTSKTLKIGLPGMWNTLHPGLQHTLFGDMVLSNQFESLVGADENGVSIALGAREWVVSSDFKSIKFTIDETHKFPDGSPLTAMDYKNSWELSAGLEPLSSNSSLLDVLYKLDGFEQFKTSGHISGIVVTDRNELELRFVSPFRTAVEYLQGSRFSAFRLQGKKFVGTGNYKITEVASDHLMLFPAKKELNLATLDIRFYPAAEILDKLTSGEIDAIHYLSGHTEGIERLVQDSKIGILIGQNSLHLALSLNCKKGVFSEVKNRIGFQYLVSKYLLASRGFLPKEPFFLPDLQFFLPFQAGRLDSSEVTETIDAGKADAAKLIQITMEEPLTIYAGASTYKFLEFLRDLGLKLSPNSGILQPKEFLEQVYKLSSADAAVEAFSVTSGDPDGLYHAMGKNGAIRTSFVYSESVNNALEDGRKETDIARLDSKYKIVARALLKEAPAIHLGFARAITVYRKDRIELDAHILRRNQGHLNFLKATN